MVTTRGTQSNKRHSNQKGRLANVSTKTSASSTTYGKRKRSSRLNKNAKRRSRRVKTFKERVEKHTLNGGSKRASLTINTRGQMKPGQYTVENSLLRHRWSQEEDEKLIAAVLKYGDGKENWQKVAARVPTKNQAECSRRWREVLKQRLKTKRNSPKPTSRRSQSDDSFSEEVELHKDDPLWNKYLKRIVNEFAKARVPKALIAAYESEGWKSANYEKIRPVQELEAARSKIRKIKERIRNSLMDLCYGEEAKKEYRIKKFGPDGEIDAKDIICAKCGKGDSEEDSNDIVMCDLEGCNKAYHQKCMEPIMTNRELQEFEDWFCRRCNCMLNCLNAINDEFETDYNNPDEVFKEDLAKEDNGAKYRGAWDTHSFTSKSDTEYETPAHETDDSSSINPDEVEERSSYEESPILPYKRRRKEINYVQLAQRMFSEERQGDSDENDTDFTTSNQELDEDATLKKFFG